MTHPQDFGQKFTPIHRFLAWKTHQFWPHIPNMTQYMSAFPGGRTARAFSSNSLVNTMEMTAAIQYTLTAAQLLGSQDYYTKSRVAILELAGVLFCENEQEQTKWAVVCSE